MNKLTAIKQHMETCCIEEYERLYYLISLLEEKDKALAFYADEESYYKAPNHQLTYIERDFGKLARKALNTSSNNEGE